MKRRTMLGLYGAILVAAASLSACAPRMGDHQGTGLAAILNAQLAPGLAFYKEGDIIHYRNNTGVDRHNVTAVFGDATSVSGDGAVCGPVFEKGSTTPVPNEIGCSLYTVPGHTEFKLHVEGPVSVGTAKGYVGLDPKPELLFLEL